MDPVSSQLRIFRLRVPPFAPTADPGHCYATPVPRSCLYRLCNSIDERHGIAVVLGGYGTGKTTLLRKLMVGMASDPARYNTAVVGSPVPSWTSFSLLEAIVAQFRLHPSKRSFAAYMEALNNYLLKSRDRISTLIIDDAQNLNKRGQLELLRLVQNLETPQHKLLNLVLFAQMEWIQVLRAAPNFLQRVNMTYTLSPLRVEELSRFIEFRISQAGGTGQHAPRFTPEAVKMIHAYSEGNPRVVVTVCRNALLTAAQLKRETIDDDLVLHTIEKTTVPDQAKLARAVGAVHPAEALAAEAPRPAFTAPVEAYDERPVIADDSISGRPMSRDERANELLLRASKQRQR